MKEMFKKLKNNLNYLTQQKNKHNNLIRSN